MGTALLWLEGSWGSGGAGGESHLGPLPRTPASLPLPVHSPSVLTLPLSFTSQLLSWRLGVSGPPLQELGGTGCGNHAVASGVTVAQGGEGREWVSVAVKKVSTALRWASLSDELSMERMGLLLALLMAGPGEPRRCAAQAALEGIWTGASRSCPQFPDPKAPRQAPLEARLCQAAP